MEDVNQLFQELANEGQEIRKEKNTAEMDAMPAKIKALTEILRSRKSIEAQREAFLRMLADMLGLADDPDFSDWLNS